MKETPEKNDVIFVEYEGRTLDGKVFDSTSGEIAKNLYGKEGPLMIIYGVDKIVPGLEKELAKMKPGEKKKLTLKPKDAFGNRKKELLNIMSLAEFKKRNVNVEKGMTVYIQRGDEMLTGIVKSINAGRVLIDFNHPLAGKEVEYELKLLEVVKDPKEKVERMMEQLNLKGSVEKKGEKLHISIKEGDETNKIRLKNALEKIMPNKFEI